MIRRRFLPFTVVLAITGCLDIQEPTTARYAVLELHASQEETVFLVTPAAIFFRGTGVILANSNRTSDACGDIDYPPSESALPFPTLDAGNVVRATLGTADPTSLFPLVQSGIERYLADGPVEFTPGDTVEFSIPVTTADLEAMSVRARTAETFTAAPIDISLATFEPVPLTWDPPTAVTTGSMMVFEFRYAAGGTQINREVICFLEDDGSSSVTRAQLASFLESETREAVVSRHRITTTTVDGTVVHISSTLELPLTVNVTP